jgi:hypothetical protein
MGAACGLLIILLTHGAGVEWRSILHPVSTRTSFMRPAAPLLMDTAALLQWK